MRSPQYLVFLLILLTVGCDLPGKPNPADRPVPVDKVMDFAILYGKRCAGCHGAEGELGPAPPLNDPLFLAMVPEAELLRVISEGRMATPGVRTPMPAFAHDQGGPLTAAQVQAIAQGIKKKWKAATPIPAGMPSYLRTESAASGKVVPDKPYTIAALPLREDDPVQTETRMRESRLKLFGRACASCHGSQGQGGKSGDQAVGAINNPAFLSLISNQALRRIIITGRPDLGMPAYDGKTGRPADFQPLTSTDIDELVKLLAQWRQGSSTPTSN